MAQPFLLGGGIGSGKSAAGARFSSLGATLVSADQIGHDVLAPGTEETRRVLEVWPEALSAEGTVDRATLAGIVFTDPDQLAQLEAITHPEIGRRIRTAVDEAPPGVAIVELPVLRDLAGMGWPWIVVDAPDDVRLARAVGRGDRTRDEVLSIMNAQPLRGEWLAAAAYVVDNSGDLDQLGDQCRRVLAAVSNR